MTSTLLATPTTVPAAIPTAMPAPTPRRAGGSAGDLPGRSGRPVHASTSTLAGRLNAEWSQLCAASASATAVTGWGAAWPALAGAHGPDQVRGWVAERDPAGRDAVLLALLELAQGGDRLAGRTVLQAMLGRAVRVATSVAGRADLRGDREEALACAVAALWQVIATYPVGRRRSRVAANLAMDTVAVVQRGHTGSSHFRRAVPETPMADVRLARGLVHYDGDRDELTGPADAELFVLLAWAVRAGVLELDQAQLLVRVYAVDEHGRPVDVQALAASEGLSWAALRQRCHRLARRLGKAAIAAGMTGSTGSAGAGGRLSAAA